MTEIVNLEDKRRQMAARKGFDAWHRRFPEAFDENTRARDLTDHTLGVLIHGGEELSMPLYDFIMGALGMGRGPRFYFMDNPDKMAVMDITLFLLDQLRFEAMRRLGWVDDHPTLHIPLLDLVRSYSSQFERARHQTPPLSRSHPLYDEYEKTFESDRPGFVRRLIPEVIKVFSDREDEN